MYAVPDASNATITPSGQASSVTGPICMFCALYGRSVTNFETPNLAAGVGRSSVQMDPPGGWKLTIADPGTGALPAFAVNATVSLLVSVAWKVATPSASVSASLDAGVIVGLALLAESVTLRPETGRPSSPSTLIVIVVSSVPSFLRKRGEPVIVEPAETTGVKSTG